jgi:trehalose transport system permease protein
MRYIFGSSGYLNELLYQLTLPLANLGLIAEPFAGINWLQDPYVLYTVIISDTWKVTPLVMLILLAGLQAIPGEVYEAARVDGASPWQQFWRVTLPLLRPAIISAVVIRGIDAFRIFVQPLALGVSGEVPVLSSVAFNEYGDGNLTLSAAASTILLVIILVSVVAFLRIFGTKEVVA